MKSKLFGLLLIAAPLIAVSGARAQDGMPEGETFFHNAGIAVRLIDPDSVVLTVGALSEDLQNTVGVFPHFDKDTAIFRLLEKRLESYLQDRIPVRVDGKRIYFRVVQWKPRGNGRADGLDSAALHVDDMFISLGAKLPKVRNHLDITANLWIEREDAGETVIQFTLFQGRDALRRLWTHREKKIRFPLHPDSLARLRAHPLPPVVRDPRERAWREH